MRRNIFRLAVPASFLLLLSSICYPATLGEVVISDVYTDSACNLPPAGSTTFSSSTERVIVQFTLEATAGDVVRLEWLQPDGTLDHNTQWDPLPNDGNWCMRAWSWFAGEARESITGTWTVRGFVNNVPLFTATFTIIGGGTPGCSYLIQPTDLFVGAAGTSNVVLVTTAADCPWTAVSNDPWIIINPPSSGTGSGAVNYTVQQNTTPVQRVGTVAIADRIFTVTQSAGQPCSYTVVPTSASVSASGESRTVAVTAGTGCAWTATSNDGWITITSGASGSGSGTVSYTVAANTSQTPRTGTMTVAGKTVTVQQAAAPSTTGPVMSGAVNAASYTPSDLPGGGLAQGSFFSLFGTRIGPTQWQQATSFPLPTTQGLGGVVVQIRKGSQTVTCPLHFAASTQINGIIPSNAPLGDAVMILTYNGQTAQIPVRIVKHNFGAFSLQAGRGPGIIQNWNSATDVPLNTPTNPARPGQLVILWGTGMGPIQGPDNVAPPVGDLPFDMEVLVAGKTAKKVYGGRAPGSSAVDNFYFEVPMDTPRNCAVPVQVRVEDTYSNIVTMAVADPGQACTSAASEIPYVDMIDKGGRTGAVVLLRADLFAEVLDEGTVNRLDLSLDVGAGIFVNAEGYTGLNEYLNSTPPFGSCQALAATQDLGSLLEDALGGLGDIGGGGDLPGGVEEPVWQGLDAGPALTIQGTAGTMPMPLLDEEQPGLYAGLLGGTIPDDLFSLGLPGDLRARLLSIPPFLDGGLYTLSGPGGADIGAFQRQFTMLPLIKWTNRDQITTIQRNRSLRVDWSNGDDTRLVIIAGGSADDQTDTVGGFICLEDSQKGSFTIPASATGVLPSTGGAVSTDGAGGLLGIIGVTIDDWVEFQAQGLDNGMIIPGSIDLRTVAVQ